MVLDRLGDLEYRLAQSLVDIVNDTEGIELLRFHVMQLFLDLRQLLIKLLELGKDLRLVGAITIDGARWGCTALLVLKRLNRLGHAQDEQRESIAGSWLLPDRFPV